MLSPHPHVILCLPRIFCCVAALVLTSWISFVSAEQLNQTTNSEAVPNARYGFPVINYDPPSHNILEEWYAWLPVNRPQAGDLTEFWRRKRLAQARGKITYSYIRTFELFGAKTRLGFEFLDTYTPDAHISLLFNGVVVEDGTDLTITIHPNNSVIQAGSHKVNVDLPDGPIQMDVHFDSKSALVSLAGTEVATVAIKYLTKSSNVALSFGHGEFAFYEVSIEPPLDPERQANSIDMTFQDFSVDATANSLRIMPSPWKDYFGLHSGLTYYSGLAEGLIKYDGVLGVSVNTLRGCHNIGQLEQRITQTMNPGKPQRMGPFQGSPVNIELSDLGTYYAGRYYPISDLMTELNGLDTKAVFNAAHIVPPGPNGLQDKNKLYWAVRLIHEAHPEAKDFIVWQAGNEVQSEHFDPYGYKRKNTVAGYEKHKYNSQDKRDFYINMYLAPTLEAIQAASEDVYGDKHAIKTYLGSTVRHYDSWLFPILDAKFKSEAAPTLNGEEVWKHVDGVCPHYTLGGKALTDLQRTYDRYVKTDKISDIWITESYGWGGRGSISIIEQGFNFLSWASANGLNADQTRTIWWGAETDRAGGSGLDMAHTLGSFIAGRDFYFSRQNNARANIYVVADSDNSDLSRFYTVVIPKLQGEYDTAQESELQDGGYDTAEEPGMPEADSFISTLIDLGELHVRLPLGCESKAWRAEYVQYSPYMPPESEVLSVAVSEGVATVTIEERITEPCIIYFTSD